MRRLLLIVPMMLAVLAPVRAQEIDTTYSFILSAGGGVTRNVSVFTTIPSGLQQMGFSGTLRCMWKPEYIIRAGLETGLTNIYSTKVDNITTSTGTTNASAVLTAVPIQLTLSMPLWDDFELYGGGGIFIVTSHLEGWGTSFTESVVSMGHIVSLAYSRPVSDRMRMGTEVKWLYMDKFQDNNITLHFMLYYTLSKY